MSVRPRSPVRPITLLPWLLAGAVAAVAYALWPEAQQVAPPAAPPPAAPSPAAAVPNALGLPGLDEPLDEWIRASNHLMDAGRYEEAVQGYTHALQLDSLNVALWVDRGACRHASGDVVGAEGDFREALRLQPEHPTAHFNLGIVYYSRGLADSAKPHFNFVVHAAPGTPEAERARALLDLLGGS